ncbi:MAG: hypothetical protein H0W83_00650 [Planctomycetes bacterium]|nr:hypothetical protein [Planctomycetota bacterium]
MIALSLSMAIVLIAVTAFRQASQTISLMQRLSTENGMLRTGYFLCTEDTDFWNSHANPDYPYLKGHMSDPVLTNSGNNLDNKRLFAPVKFQVAPPGGIDFNPNWEQPNDARGWYRNYLTANPRTLIYDRSIGNKVDGYPLGHVMLDSAENSEVGIDKVIASDTCLPRGWAPWHLIGDYACLSTINLNYAGVSAPDYGQAVALKPDDPTLRGARPNLMWQLFKKLGHVGVFTYMPAGTISLIQCPNLNDTVANIKDASKNWCKGEIPWSLSRVMTSGPTKTTSLRSWLWWYPNGPDSIMTWTPLPAIVTCPTTAQVADNSLGNYFMGMPGENATVAMHCAANYYWSSASGGYVPADEAHGSSVPLYASDLDHLNGDGYYLSAGGYETEWTGLQARNMVALMYGTKFVAADMAATTFDSEAIIDSTTRDPYRTLDKETPGFSGAFTGNPNTTDYEQMGDASRWDRSAQTMTFWRQMLNYGSTTVHVPQNYTDAIIPNMTNKATSTPSLSTGIIRYRYRSYDKALCSVRVQDPTTGRVIELGFTLVGTTLRGARQHWGWKTEYDAPTIRKIGDLYE